MRQVLFVFLLALATSATGAVKYVPANDSQPLLRRDLVPLDVDAIRELADHLAILADGPPSRSASQLRNRVQAVTLSQRLSPAQARSRAILTALANREKRPKPQDNEINSAKRDVRAAANWLAKLPADSEGHHLGQLLFDILQPLAESESPVKLHDLEGAPKRWKGVVAKASSFESLEKPPPTRIETPQPEPPVEEESGYAISALLTEIPMIASGMKPNSPASAGLVKTSLVITKSNEGGKLNFQPPPNFPTKPLEKALETFFKSIDQPLPKGHNINVNTDRRRYLPKNRENIAAPLAMMLDSALSGRPLRRNTIFFARLRADGSLEKPANAWSLLLDLEKLRMPDGTRLIVGSGMLEEMTGLLVLQKGTFFTKYEVIEASSFEAAREFFYDDGKPSPDFSSAIAGYEEVREKANLASNFNTFLSLSTVESRLIKARDFAPQHLSARMLAAQAIRRPAYFSRFMFAQELDRKLERISKIDDNYRATSDRDVKNAYKAARAEIEPLLRLVERQERLILEDAIDLLKKLNSAGRMASSSYNSTYEEDAKRQADLKAFKAELNTFRGKLREIYQPSKKEE